MKPGNEVAIKAVSSTLTGLSAASPLTSADIAMREYLTFASPAEFAWRNIFTEERPLRRARSPQSTQT